MAVIDIEGDELAADRLMELAQDRLHMGLEILVGLVAAQLSN